MICLTKYVRIARCAQFFYSKYKEAMKAHPDICPADMFDHQVNHDRLTDALNDLEDMGVKRSV